MGNSLKYRAKILTAAWLLLCFTASANAGEQISISIGEQARCEYSEVLIPVYASEFLNVAALTLYIEIDTLITEFIDVQNLHPELAGGIFTSNFIKSSSNIAIIWAKMLPVFIDDGKLFDIKLQYHEGSAPLVFSENCEVAFSDYNIADNVIYDDGLIKPIHINIFEHPESVHVEEGKQAKFRIKTENMQELEFKWQLHDGIKWQDIHDDHQFAGSGTTELIINDVSHELNNTILRCMVYLDQCLEYSDPALLTVSEVPTQVTETDQTVPEFNVFPNPCSSLLNYDINAIFLSFDLKLLNIKGEVVYHEYDARPQGSIPVNAFEAGTYFLQLITHNNQRKTVKVIVIK